MGPSPGALYALCVREALTPLTESITAVVVIDDLSERREMWSETNPALMILDLQAQQTTTHHCAASIELRLAKSKGVDGTFQLLQRDPTSRIESAEAVPKVLQGLDEHHDRDRAQLPIRGATLRDPEQPGVS